MLGVAMRLVKFFTNGLIAAAFALSFIPEASAWSRRGGAHPVRANGPTQLGPFVEEGWDREDWSRAPSVRGWGFSAPAINGPGAYAFSEEWYPWGYTTPFVRVGRHCVASEITASVGGAWARYQRVRPSYYCR
jgi:hypothetical protein